MHGPIKSNQVSEAGRNVLDRTQASDHGGSVGSVVLVAVILVGAATGLLFIGRPLAEPYILVLLSLLAAVGVFLLFALAAGIVRWSRGMGANPLIKAVADGAFDGLAVTDRDGRVVVCQHRLSRPDERHGSRGRPPGGASLHWRPGSIRGQSTAC